MSAHPRPPGSFLPLHPLEFRILMISLGGPAHGFAIVQEIEEREKGSKRIYPANLYRRIRDLLAKGMLEDADPPAGEADDPRRRYFQITALGRQVAAAEASRLRSLVGEAVDRGLLSTNGSNRS
jgi:DNA-binding PadR family transcriptional regulator